jgi:transcriptional regulator with XRE-family HTH domain
MGETREANEIIGARVRQHCTGRGWTLDELAARSGVSRRQLVNIERGDGNPSIATLLRLSDALGIGLPVLVDLQRQDVATITRHGQAPVLWNGPNGGQACLVAGTHPPDVVELWDWTLHPGDQHRSDAHTPGTRELLHVLEGHIDLTVGEHTDRLQTGDAATFNSDIPHGYANPADATSPARFALTVYQPNVGTNPA